MNTKTCADCKGEKPIIEFGKDKYNKDSLNYDCKQCKNKKAKERILAKPEQYKARNSQQKEYRDAYYKSPKGIESSRRAHLKQNYGISLEDYDKMLELQNGTCAICGGLETGYRNKMLSVDHNHITGEIRGLLCNTCNRALGLFKDNKQTLEKATKYLENYEERY